MVNAPEEGYGGPDDAVFVPGVDYVSGWRAANEAACELNDVLSAHGMDGRYVRAVPHAGAHGEPVVKLAPEAAQVIARALRAALGATRVEEREGREAGWGGMTGERRQARGCASRRTDAGSSCAATGADDG
jgi:hypothetical protein